MGGPVNLLIPSRLRLVISWHSVEKHLFVQLLTRAPPQVPKTTHTTSPNYSHDEPKLLTRGHPTTHTRPPNWPNYSHEGPLSTTNYSLEACCVLNCFCHAADPFPAIVVSNAPVTPCFLRSWLRLTLPRGHESLVTSCPSVPEPAYSGAPGCFWVALLVLPVRVSPVWKRGCRTLTSYVLRSACWRAI